MTNSIKSDQENLFDNAMERYRSGAEAKDLIEEFEVITASIENFLFL